jgi:hypothetical protein
MKESKCVLGWEINTRSLSISLLLDKHRNRTLHISSLISGKRVRFKEIETHQIRPALAHLRSQICIFLAHSWTMLMLVYHCIR